MNTSLIFHGDNVPYKDKRKARDQAARWKKEHPAENLEHKAKWRRNNRKKALLSSALWRKKHPQTAVSYVEKRRAKEQGSGGAYTSSQWIALCDKYHNRCLCYGRKRKLTADHVVPVSKGGSSNISNIQPLCGPCNSKKGTKIIDFRKPVRFHEHPLGVDGIAQAVYKYCCVEESVRPVERPFIGKL